MSNIIYPDYNHSILNSITSVLKHYKVKSNHSTLSKLDKILEAKKYKNIVFIILDGMGEHILNHHSHAGFFKAHEIDCITSIYPSTTTAALTTYYSGLPPYESGWIAWSQYFKEYGRAIDMFSHNESYKEDSLANAKIDVFETLVKYETVFERIEKASPEVHAYDLSPTYSEKRAKRSIRTDSLDEVCDTIKLICNDDNQNFIIAYVDTPDSLLHKFGCTSIEVTNMIKTAEEKIEQLYNELKTNEDTLIIVSADHGHKDINKPHSILDFPELLDCLYMPVSLESRIVAFWVKDDKKQEFENLFNTIFKDEFLLLPTSKALEMNLFGFGNKHKKLDDFLGNYLALSISDSMIRIETYLADGKPIKKSTHCGLTKEEMEVPLIVLE